MGGLKKEEIEENQEKGKQWAEIAVEDLKDKAMLQFEETRVKLWPQWVSPSVEKKKREICVEIISTLTPKIYESLSFIYFGH